MATGSAKMSENDIKEAITQGIHQKFDNNGSGFISLLEMHHTLSNCGVHLSNDQFLTLAKTSSVCQVDYSQLLQEIFGPDTTKLFGQDARAHPAKTSMQDDKAEALYAEVEKKLGGHEGIKKYAAKSQQLAKEVKRRMKDKEPWRQDVIFHHEGLQALIKFESN